MSTSPSSSQRGDSTHSKNLSSELGQGSVPFQPDPKAQAYLKSIVQQSKGNVPEKTNSRILESLDFFFCTFLTLPASIMFGLSSFSRDYSRYRFNLALDRLPEKTRKIHPHQIHGMLFTSHLLRGMYFWPILAISQQLPYSITGNPRWSTEEYILSGAFLGLGYGALTKYKSPIHLTGYTIAGSLGVGLWGQLADLNGKPLFPFFPFVGKRRYDDEAARRNLSYMPWYKDHIRI